jgi:putative flippase GtrA
LVLIGSSTAQVLRFAAVGVIGFVVDAGVLLAVVTWLHWSPLPARIASFLIAATVTFVLNQRFTFRLQERFDVYRFISYLAATAVGALINIGIYHLWVLINDAAPMQLVIGTAFGSLVAMFVNYFVSSLIVFRSTRQLDFVSGARK